EGGVHSMRLHHGANDALGSFCQRVIPGFGQRLLKAVHQALEMLISEGRYQGLLGWKVLVQRPNADSCFRRDAICACTVIAIRNQNRGGWVNDGLGRVPWTVLGGEFSGSGAGSGSHTRSPGNASSECERMLAS